MATICAALLAGCFKMAVPDVQPTPVALWPPPPEVPRISYVSSIHSPADLGIREGVVRGFLRYLAGRPQAELVSPQAVAVDSAGLLYVVDGFQKQVHVFDARRGRHRVLSRNGPALVSPVALAVDERRRRLYVSDSAAPAVRVFDLDDGTPRGEIRSGGLGRPTGLAITPAGDELLVADASHGNLVRYALPGHALKGVIGELGQAGGQFHAPTHLAFDRDGRLLVTDALNFRVQALTAAGAVGLSFGAPGDGPGSFSRPKGVASDSDGNLYVVDALFGNVQVFDRDGRLLMAFGAPGQGAGEFWLPSGLWIDAQDRIYVADSYNRRVQIFQYLKDGELP